MGEPLLESIVRTMVSIQPRAALANVKEAKSPQRVISLTTSEKKERKFVRSQAGRVAIARWKCASVSLRWYGEEP